MSAHPNFNVVAIVNLAYQTHVRLLDGILSYVKTHSPWTLNLVVGRRDEQKRFDPATLDGLILHNSVPSWLRGTKMSRIPTVVVEPVAGLDFRFCSVSCDNAPIAATAARYMLAKQCETYAFVHASGQAWSDTRGRLFAEAINAGGGRFLGRASGQKSLARLISSAPKPLGVFAATDILARVALDACRVAGCRVPDDVLVLGVDNDVTLCEMSTPTLSSIQLTSYDAGYRLAEQLDRAMRGEFSPDKMPDVPYTGNTVVERISTQRSFAYDTLVHRCRELLETEFAAPIRVADLATRFRVSRRTLETHFRAITGTTIAEEVMRLRIEHAKRLLATTGDSQERIATVCGFYNASHLSAVFRRRCGASPSSFRAQ
jgi:LacI family transcriptional regulator